MLINLAQTHPQFFVILIVSLMFALTFHEFAHAYVAYLCGDSTAKSLDRMNVNPLKHLDLFGSLMLLFVGFGYAKPVPVDPRNFRSRNSHFYVAAAGPGMNLLLTLGGAIVFYILMKLGILDQSRHMVDLLYLFMFINMNLCLFNLIPLGPLDGSYVLPHFLPRHIQRRYELWNLQYGTYIIMGAFLISFVLPQVNLFGWIADVSRAFIRILLP